MHLQADDKQVLIYGASGYGYSAALSLMHAFRPHRLCKIIGFVDDFADDSNRMFEDLPIYTLAQWREMGMEAAFVITISEPRARRRLVEKVINAGGNFDILYDKLPITWFTSVNIDIGCLIYAPIYIGPLTNIGRHVQLMPMSSIGHDVTIHDYCTVCPSCTISGYVILESDVFLGAGTVVVNGRRDKPLIVGKGVKAAAGSVITRSVPAGARIAGNPARPLREIARERMASGR